MNVCPLIFEPILKPRIWGGRKLRELLGKCVQPSALGARASDEAEPIGESWEVVDLETDQGIARSGPARGRTLGELVRDWGRGLLGGAAPVEGRFPLMVKFLDAREALSVQVHPRESSTRPDGTRARLKHEMWYIVAAEPDAVIYRGLQPGVDRARLRQALDAGEVESVLRAYPAKPGAAYYLPAGVVHALGGGAVVAEVTTVSDTTYRLYDWGRVDPATGAPRTLHVEEALASIDFAPPDPAFERRSHTTSMWTTVTRLITSDAFVVERVRMPATLEMEIPYAGLVLWIVLEGRGAVGYKGAAQRMAFGPGDVVLLPAELPGGVLQTHTDCMWLEVTIPTPSDLAEFERVPAERLRSSGGAVQLNVPGAGR